MHILSILFHLCIKFQVQIHYSSVITKKKENTEIYELDLPEFLSFLLLLN
jgi:hypothetical protein